MTWKWKQIRDACILSTGGTPSKSNASYYYNGNINWLVSGDINQHMITNCENKITELGLSKSNAKYLPINSVMIALNGQGKTRGKVAMLKIKATCNQSLVSIYPKSLQEILPEFIFWNLRGRYDELRMLTGDTGNDRRGLNMKIIGNISIPIPSIREQKRLVKILDEAFTVIAKAKENVEQNLQYSNELFESYLNSYFANPNRNWTRVLLKNVCKFQNGYAFKSKTFKEEGLPILRISNIEKRGISRNRLVYFEEKDYSENFEKYRVHKGELVIAMSGATTGKLAISNMDEIFYLNQRVGKFLPSNKLHTQFLYYFLSTRIEENLRIAAGSAQPNLSTEQINNFQLPFPSMAEQKEIVAKLDSLSAETKKLEEIYRQKLVLLEELKKSLLHQAFTGQL